MKNVQKYKGLLVIALIAAAGVTGIFLYFSHFYQNDVKALTDFTIAYGKYDQAISDVSKAVNATNTQGPAAMDDLQHNADVALADLDTKASVRISSLIKNDAGLMITMLKIGDLSRKELATLKACQRAAADKSAALDGFKRELGDLTDQKQMAYAHFLELAGLTK